MERNFKKLAKPVEQIDVETGEVVASYSSITEAAKALGKMSKRTGITLVCEGYQNTAHGYKWKYC